MKILFVNYEYPPLGGGGGVALQHLVGALGQLHEVQVLTSRSRGMPRVEQQDDLLIHRARVLGRNKQAVASMRSMFSFVPAGVLRGWLLLREVHFDLINTWFAVPSGPTGVLLSRMFKIPHVLTLIAGDVYDPSKWYSPHRNALARSVVRWVIQSSRFCTAISTDVCDRARELLGEPVEIDILPLGIAPPQFRPADRMTLGMERDAFYCITVGRLIPRKRLGLLLEIFARSADPKLRLLIVGEGPEEKALRRRVRQLELERRVEFFGHLPDEKKFQYLSNCDAYVSVSAHEGFGLVFLEAMACALPILAPVMGGQRDFLVHGGTGLTLESDGSDLLRRINELLDDPEKTIAMRRFSREHVEQFYAANVADLWAEKFQAYLKSLY